MIMTHFYRAIYRYVKLYVKFKVYIDEKRYNPFPEGSAAFLVPSYPNH